MPKFFHLFTTPLGYLAIWLDESSKARIWRHYLPEVVKFVYPGMLFEEGGYPVHQMLKNPEIAGMKNIGYDNSHQGDAL